MSHVCHLSPAEVDRLKVRDFWGLVRAIDDFVSSSGG